ncbi:hypothetical protein LCGC14_1878450 [marine sediment metagenome]|uniref:Winged helix-turn helix domain-containing protein n=1 Tax=marine sediment metagenome TaxID=412755 RepID=A0A0F9G2X4_9ZZZZ
MEHFEDSKHYYDIIISELLLRMAKFFLPSNEGRYLDEGGEWGKKKIEINPGLKTQVIWRYNSGVGTTKLSRFLASHGIEMSSTTLWRLLVDWGVEVRKRE